MLDTYEQKALQCRRLAASIVDSLTQERLLSLAEEYDAKHQSTVAAREPAEPSHAGTAAGRPEAGLAKF